MEKSLVQLPEYEFFAEYSCCNTMLYSNFQVSAELKMLLIRDNKAEAVTSDPFLSYTFILYNIAKNDGNESIDLTLPDRSVLIITSLDLSKPVYGSAWGYATPPFSERIINILDELGFSGRIYSSERIYAYHF